MSEDLDFTLPMPVEARRSERSRFAEAVGAALADIDFRLPGLRTLSPWRGANNSLQYTAVIAYTSLTSREQETIRLEVGLREPLLTPACWQGARTLLRGPAGNRPLIEPIPVLALSHIEAMAEKLRAALSRREPTIRDFYDIDHAVRYLDLDLTEPAFLEVVRRKLAMPGNPPIDVTPERFGGLSTQRETMLRPILRTADFDRFDLKRACAAVKSVAEAIAHAR